jgi:16S rRNA (guanine(1405)-N(7))-methyltransferase
MTMMADERLDELVAAVLAGGRYKYIQPDLARRIGAQELAKGRSLKDAVKETRGKLHQVGGAYQETAPDYARLKGELAALSRELDDPAARDFCRRVMRLHASTRERLAYLDAFYSEALASIAPLHRLTDLACGLNPLALAWMPLARDVEINTCDIYADMADFLNTFFVHFGVNGHCDVLDLTAQLPEQPAQVAFLLKTLPCLEQLDKGIGARLLEGIRAEHLLVSFPARSLGGRSKGMVQNYEAHFRELLGVRPWRVQRWEVRTELVFLVSK